MDANFYDTVRVEGEKGSDVLVFDSNRGFGSMNKHKPVPHSIIIYTTSFCPVCTMVKHFLEMNKFFCDEVNIDLRPMERLKLIKKTKKLTVPQTNINGQWISGFHPVAMLEIMNEKGSADPFH